MKTNNFSQYKEKFLNLFSSQMGPTLAAAGVFVFAFIWAALIILRLEQDRLQLERNYAANIAGSYTKVIQSTIEHSMFATSALAALVQQGNGEIAHFDELANHMLRLYPGIDSLQLAPGGIVQQIVPLEGNEKEIGHDLFHDPVHSSTAFLARDSGQLSILSPIPVIQGPYLGGVGRFPVFLEDAQGNPYFWGFTSVTVHLQEIISIARLPQLEEQGLAYELWCIRPGTGEKQVISASGAPLATDPVEQNIQLFNLVWTLSVTPAKGWNDTYGLFFKILQVLVFSGLLAWLTKLMLDLKKSKIMLENLALSDTVTGLPNRRLLDDRLRQAIIQSRRTKSLVGVCFIDLDNYKIVNDMLGHQAGDKVLVEISARLAGGLRESDTLARFGGDEFVAVLTDLPNKAECISLVSRMIRMASIPVVLETKTIIVSVSIGITIYPWDESDPDLLLRHADQALQEAKQSGKSQWRMFTPEGMSD